MAANEVSRSREFGLTILAIVAAGASVNFFILGSAGVVPFLEYRNYILASSFFILLFIAIYGFRKNKRLANRLVTGLWIGIIATLALEAVRVPSIYVHWIPHDDMIALPGKLLTNPPTIDTFDAMIMGDHHGGGKNAMQHENDNMNSLAGPADPMQTASVSNISHGVPKHKDQNTMNDNMMTDSLKNPNSKIINNQKGQQSPILMLSQPESKIVKIPAVADNHHSSQTMVMSDNMQASPSELVVGGLYHFWNGATMAAVYCLVVGRGRWYYGLVWGFIIHIGMMLAPWMIPMVGPFGINYAPGYTIFIASLMAHLSYGAVLGILAQRFVKDKGSLINIIRSMERSLVH